MKALDRYKVRVKLATETGSSYIPEDEDPILYKIRRQQEAETTHRYYIFDVRDIYDAQVDFDVDTDKCVRAIIYTEVGDINVDVDEIEELLTVWMKRTYRR